MEELRILREERNKGNLSLDDFETRKSELKQEREAGKRVSVPATPPQCTTSAEEDRRLSRFSLVTWDLVSKSKQLDSLEDPVSGSALDKEEYFRIYGEMLKTLDGQDALPDTFVDFFFERDAVNQSHLRFKDETVKGDWMDWAEELGIQPSLEAIKAGETKEEKEQREGNSLPSQT